MAHRIVKGAGGGIKMAVSREVKDALREETERMRETEGFRSRFAKLVENYMDGMGSEAEIAEVIELVDLAEDAYED